MNLLFDPWVPVTLVDGSSRTVAPIDIPGSSFTRVGHPRADYAALTTEFLVDLFQTLAAPLSDEELVDFSDQSPADFRDRFEAARAAFELDGLGPRFMQAPAFTSDPAKFFSVTPLFFEAPGENTVEHNKELFTASGAYTSICPHCAPVALYLCNSHARMGGQGYQTGPRETSALAVLVTGETLWETIALNVLPANWFTRNTPLAAIDGATHVLPSFPWMHPDTLLSTKQTVPPDVLGLFGALWWTPVGLHLHWSDNTNQESCSACGKVHSRHATSLLKQATKATLPSGVQHPRTGFNLKGNKGAGRAVETPKDGFTLEHWQAIVLGDDVKGTLPAWGQLSGREKTRYKLHFFGFAMNQMSPLSWLDEVTPTLLSTADTDPAVLRLNLDSLVTLVQPGVKALREALYWSNEKKVLDNPRLTFRITPEQGRLALWDAVSSYLATALAQAHNDPLTAEQLTDFQNNVRNAAVRLFEAAVVDYGVNPEATQRLIARERNLAKKLTPKS